MTDFIDEKLPIWVNVLVVTANIINFVYNIPQMYKTFKRKSTRDISGLFLLLRVIGNVLMLIYTIYILDIQLSIANSVTVLSSIFLCAYKLHDIYEDHLIKARIKNTSNANKTITSIHILILELQEMLRGDAENIIVENITIKNNRYKVLYLGTENKNLFKNEYESVKLDCEDENYEAVELT